MRKAKFTEESIREIFEHLFFNKDTPEMNILDKIIPGYVYRNAPDSDNYKKRKHREVRMMTGSGGAIMLVHAMRAQGLPDLFIGDCIEIFLQGKWYKLNDVNITKSNNEPNEECRTGDYES